MKDLKVLPVENLEEKIDKFDEVLSSNHIFAQQTSSSPIFYDCVAQCISYIYGGFGLTGEYYSSEYVQSSIDYAYAQSGIETGRGVLSSDFSSVMTGAFEGSMATITNDYVIPPDTYVTIVASNHAVILKSLYTDQNNVRRVSCYDPQSGCVADYRVSDIQLAYKAPGTYPNSY